MRWSDIKRPLTFKKKSCWSCTRCRDGSFALLFSPVYAPRHYRHSRISYLSLVYSYVAGGKLRFIRFLYVRRQRNNWNWLCVTQAISLKKSCCVFDFSRNSTRRNSNKKSSACWKHSSSQSWRWLRSR